MPLNVPSKNNGVSSKESESADHVTVEPKDLNELPICYLLDLSHGFTKSKKIKKNPVSTLSFIALSFIAPQDLNVSIGLFCLHYDESFRHSDFRENYTKRETSSVNSQVRQRPHMKRQGLIGSKIDNTWKNLSILPGQALLPLTHSHYYSIYEWKSIYLLPPNERKLNFW